MGPFIIMFAATLWAVDALIRTPLTKSIPAASIVLYEHVIGIFVLSPLFVRSLPVLKSLSIKVWARVFFLSLVSSVAGTLLFTQALASSFATYDFITPLLLQKLQPIIVVLLAALFLKEKLHKQFFFWAPVALLGSYLVSFGTSVPHLSFAGKELVVLLSLGAAACWGSGTILSKLLLREYSSRDATFLRFLAAIPIAFVIASILGQYIPPSQLTSGNLLRFVIIGLSTGAVGVLLYYAGLTKTKAHIATFAELTFPAVSVLIGITSLNPYGAPQTLSAAQIIGILLLIGAVLKISFLKKENIITGIVVKGHGDGKKLGFPTANISLSSPIDLPYGVYACTTEIDNKVYKGVLHYGPRLVFDETIPQFEVHIFHFKKNLYGKELSVEVGTFIRKTKNFANKQALVAQIKRDCEEAKKVI